MATCESTTLARPIRIPLFIKDGDHFVRASESTVFDCARELAHAQFRPGAPVLDDPSLVRRFLTLQLAPQDHEVFAIILLDAKKRLIEYVELFHGSVTGATVYTGEVIKWAIAKRAAGVVLVHNHLSGSAEPSLGDRHVTARVKSALALVDVELVDHFIVGEHVISMKVEGLI